MATTSFYNFSSITGLDYLDGVPVLGEPKIYYEEVESVLLRDYATNVPAIKCSRYWSCPNSIFSNKFPWCSSCTANKICELLTGGYVKNIEVDIVFKGNMFLNIKDKPFVSLLRGIIYLNGTAIEGGFIKKNGKPTIVVNNYFNTATKAVLRGKCLCQSIWNGQECKGSKIPHWVYKNVMYIEQYCEGCAKAQKNSTSVKKY
jgi:hypothetical protein